MPTMIYHAPFTLNPDATAASGIRPVKMLGAFRDLGYDVLVVAGRASERRRAIRKLKERVRAGDRFEFLYSECATLPTALTEPHHFPSHPLTDPLLFRFCARNGIPTGVFYRDMYWRFPEYLQTVNRVVALGTRALYRWDLLTYRWWVTRVFVPSLRMAKQIPIVRSEQFTALPPGTEPSERESGAENGDGVLSLFYVGGLGYNYRLHEAVRAVGRVAGSELILCTRPEQWAALKDEYLPLAGDARGCCTSR